MTQKTLHTDPVMAKANRELDRFFRALTLAATQAKRLREERAFLAWFSTQGCNMTRLANALEIWTLEASKR